jgi:hypothetical protein
MCVGSLCCTKKETEISKRDSVLSDPETFWKYPEKVGWNDSQNRNKGDIITREMASRKLERRPTLGSEVIVFTILIP